MFLFHDFLPMWAAAKAAQGGLNPYNPADVVRMLEGAGVALNGANPGNFMYPPWTLWLFGLQALIPLHVAKWAWCGQSLASLGYTLLVSRLRPPEGQALRLQPVWVLMALIAFFPVFKLLYFGQSSWIVLLGILGWWRGWCSRKYFRAGCWLSLAAFKLHICVPLVCVALFYAAKDRRLALFIGFVCAFSTQLVLSLLICPGVLHFFFEMAGQRVVSGNAVLTPTTYDFLLAISGINLRAWGGDYLALGLGSALLMRSAGTRPLDQPLRDAAIFWGLALSPFLWSNDYILLLPFFLSQFQQALFKWGRSAVLVVSCGLVFLFGIISTDWIGLAFLAWLCLAMLGLLLLRGSAERRCSSKTLLA
jgi:hypothetical protein